MALAAGLGADAAGVGHDQHIAQVGDARSVKVILCEAFNDAVGIVIAGAPVPAFVDIAGAGLYGAEWNAGPEEGMAVSAGADVGVDGGKEGAFVVGGGGALWRGGGGRLGGEGKHGEGGEE